MKRADYAHELRRRHVLNLPEATPLPDEPSVISIAEYDARQRLTRWRNEYRILQDAKRRGVDPQEALRIAQKARAVHRHQQRLDALKRAMERRAIQVGLLLAAAVLIALFVTQP